MFFKPILVLILLILISNNIVLKNHYKYINDLSKYDTHLLFIFFIFYNVMIMLNKNMMLYFYLLFTRIISNKYQ